MATMNPNGIKTHETFSSLFPINQELLAKIEADMRQQNYDYSQPVILATWNGQNEPVCIDGHTRLQAAINVGIEGIPVFFHEYDDEHEALEKAIRLQRNRRNMSDAEIVTCVEALDKRRQRGGDRRSAEAKSIPQSYGIQDSRSASAKETGELLGVSSRKVEQVRTIIDHSDPETLQAVKNNEVSVNKAYQETQRKRKEAKGVVKFPKPDPDPWDYQSIELLEDIGRRPSAGFLEELEEQIRNEEDTCCNLIGDTSIILTKAHYRALKALGGSIDDHLASAIDAYLDSYSLAS